MDREPINTDPENGYLVDEPSKEPEVTEEETDTGSDEEEPTDENEDTEPDEESDDEEDEFDSMVKDTKRTINVDGTNIEIENDDELAKIAERSLSSSRKFDAHKDDISIIEGVRNEGLSNDDLYLLVEAKKGNKQAIAKLLKSTGSSMDDITEILDDEDKMKEVDNYIPNEYKVDQTTMEIRSIIKSAEQDTKSFPIFENLISTEFDDQSKRELFTKPDLMQFVADTVKSGAFEGMSSTYMKKKLLGGNTPTLNSFIDAFDEYTKEVASQEKDKIVDKVEKSNAKTAKRKKIAGSSKTKTDKKTSDQPDFKNMTDEEFEKYHNNVINGLY